MNRSLVLLSGEGTTIPLAEARSLFLTYDPESRFHSPEPRIMIAESLANPALIERRIAFSRRVGALIEDPSALRELLRGRRVRVRRFDLRGDRRPESFDFLNGIDLRVDLENPEFEITLVAGERDYVVLTKPLEMQQSWSLRRPRRRAFFHPSAIFPKLSRALVNLTRCTEGSVLFDPFCGTGSISMEAAEIGIDTIAMDRTTVMARGALANMRKFGHHWEAVVRGDASRPPVREIDGIATDVPYGRAASTEGSDSVEVMSMATEVLPSTMRRGAIMVLMHPDSSPVMPSRFLTLLDEHRLYVHKRLTRVITILRKN